MAYFCHAIAVEAEDASTAVDEVRLFLEVHEIFGHWEVYDCLPWENPKAQEEARCAFAKLRQHRERLLEGARLSAPLPNSLEELVGLQRYQKEYLYRLFKILAGMYHISQYFYNLSYNNSDELPCPKDGEEWFVVLVKGYWGS